MISIKRYIRHETIKLKKSVNVRFRVYYNKLNLFYTADVQILPSLWDFNSGLYGFSKQYIDPQYKAVNERLDLIQNIIQDICISYDKQDLSSEFITEKVTLQLHIHDTGDDLLNKPFKECFQTYVMNHKMDEIRRNYFKVVFKSFTAFENYLKLTDKRIKPITYNTITHKLLNQFAEFISKEKELSEKFPFIYNGETRKLKDRGSETGENYLRYLRCVINNVREESGTSFYPMQGYRIKTPKTNKPVALTLSEIKQLYDYVPDKKTLRLVRDNFLLQLCIVARVNDFYKISYKNILYNASDEINYLCFTPQKTSESSGKQVEVPLNNLAREIIYKYKDLSDLLVIHLSGQYYNRQLKELFKKAGLNRIVVQYDKITKTDVHKPLHTFVSSNTARKTAISRLYNLGCPLDMINDMCGHVGDDIKTRYAEFDLSSKLEFLNKICPWYTREQPLFDVQNNNIIDPNTKNPKHIIFSQAGYSEVC